MRNAMLRKTSVTVSLTALAASVLPMSALLAAPAHAGDDDVEKAKSCGGWRLELKVGPEDSGWEVESDIDDAGAGSKWRVIVKQDGRTVFSRIRQAGPGGDVEVDLRRPDSSGSDTFRLVTHPKGRPGNRCALQITR